jgi:hypothetical protein
MSSWSEWSLWPWLFIAADMGIDTAQFLSDLLRSLVDREWAKIHKRMHEEGEGKP